MIRKTLIFSSAVGATCLAVAAVVHNQNQQGMQIEVPALPPSGCPVDHTKMGPPPAACPMTSHAEEVSSENQMIPENQRPREDQTMPLPIQRVKSSIPRGKQPEPDKERWEYPSEQMFYNALRRKGWQGVREEDISAIVAIHNTTNERCWAEVLKWELVFHAGEYDNPPRLVKFGGKYKEISIKARLKMFFQGAKRPFDRHDWIVDRNGKEVRYIIDFYDGTANNSGLSMHLDVRPTLDSPSGAWDRMRMFFGFSPTLEEVFQQYPKLKNRMDDLDNNKL